MFWLASSNIKHHNKSGTQIKKTPGRSGSLPKINKFSIILFFLYKLQISFVDQSIERKFPFINGI
jgi:hypothetical protein